MFESFLPINWSEFHFIRPQLLWLLLPVFLILVIGLLGLRQNVKWRTVIAPHLRPFMIRRGSEWFKAWMQFLLFLACTIGVIAVSGPTWKRVETPDQQLETPMVILLDLSQSMLCTDIKPTRMERAKFKIIDLLENNPKVRISLIGYAGSAHTIVPLTSDYAIIESHLIGLSPKVMPLRGSNLNAALELADATLNTSKAPGNILLFSDDFDTQSLLAVQQHLDTTKTHLDIMPMNTISGADVPSFTGKGFLKDQGKIVHSFLNQPVLIEIASLENVTVHQLTLDNSDMELIVNRVNEELEFSDKEEDEKDSDKWEDYGWILIIPMALLVLIWFRKGWVVYTIPLFFVLSSCSGDSKFKDLWLTHDYQGQQLSNQQNYSEAANRYEDPMRKGIAYFKAGDINQAIEAFSKDTTALGAYNLGLAYYQAGAYEAAEWAFDKALSLDPNLDAAKSNQQNVQRILEGQSEVSAEEAEDARKKGSPDGENNIQNTDPEDLGGGGQEATKEDMKKERKEETVETDIRKGKELDEIPDYTPNDAPPLNDKVLMRKVDDDPALFLKRKFAYQVKKNSIKTKQGEKNW